MKKLTLLLVLLLIVAFSTTLLAEKKYAILKPARDGQKSEAIPITKHQLEKIMKSEAAARQVMKAASTTGIADTMTNSATVAVNWGVAVGDTNTAYYDPPAACIIKAIGIVGQDWGGSPLATGFNLMIHEPGVPWVWDADSADANAWYTKDKYGYQTILGSLMWGDFPVNIVDGERVWTDMFYLGIEPDTHGDPFLVSITPFGDAAAYQGTDSEYWNAGDPDGWKLAKYYGAGRGPYGPQFVVREYVCSWLIAVEFYENTPPSVDPASYGSVLAADAKTLECDVTDIDANDANQAGAASVTMFYSVDGGAEMEVACTLASGTDTDGTWEGVVPGGYMAAGQTLSYYFVATDKAGQATTSPTGSFGYFEKKENILVVYNDNGSSYPSWILSPYYDNLWVDGSENPFMYDVWVGLADGPLTNTLVDMYDNIVHIDAFSPAYLYDDVYAAWFAAGPKNLCWSSQEWGYALTGGADSTFAADDWHNMYMGIGTIGPMDINANYEEAFPINPVADDVISGGLAAYVADSLQLYHNSVYELGYNDWCDEMTASEGAVVCFTDSAQGRTMGVHKETNGTKGVFLTFDQLCLDTWALPSYTVTDGYAWVTPNVSSVGGNALNWFGLTGVGVEIPTAGITTKYDLSQNYPNPFNPETKISYSVAKAGHVKLAVYNVLGQKVADLVDDVKVANTYKVNFDASNLTSGVYFYRLEVGDYSKTMKMMLLQ
jgi:hypothetical protein